MEKEYKIIGAVIVVILLLGVGFITGYAVKEDVECEDCPDVPDCDINTIYDVDRDGDIDKTDVDRAWSYVCNNRYPTLIKAYYQRPNITDTVYRNYYNYKQYNYYAEKLYDVNVNGVADWEDVNLIWENIE